MLDRDFNAYIELLDENPSCEMAVVQALELARGAEITWENIGYSTLQP